MALSTLERELLIAARAHIKSRQCRYICLALRHAAYFDFHGVPTVYIASERLRTYIMTALGLDASGWPIVGLEAWCRVHNHRLVSPEKQREARLAWIDWMLEEEETK